MRVAGPFGCRCQTIPPCSVSTSRSSNRTGGFPASGSRTRIVSNCVVQASRPRKVASSHRESDQTKGLVQRLVGEACGSTTRLWMFRSQTPTEPVRDVMVHGTRGFAHRTLPEVVCPAPQLAVQAIHDLGHVLESPVPAGLFADRFAELWDLLPRGSSAQIPGFVATTSLSVTCGGRACPSRASR